MQIRQLEIESIYCTTPTLLVLHINAHILSLTFHTQTFLFSYNILLLSLNESRIEIPQLVNSLTMGNNYERSVRSTRHFETSLHQGVTSPWRATKATPLRNGSLVFKLNNSELIKSQNW